MINQHDPTNQSQFLFTSCLTHHSHTLKHPQTKTSFAQGVQNVLNFAKDAFAKIKVRPSLPLHLV